MPPPLWTLRRYEECESTQILLKAWAEEGAPEGAVVQAQAQSGGYGRRGREWVSPPGNLYLSLLLRPSCPPHDISQMALVAGVALAETAGRYTPGVILKWPNDLLERVGGRKLAGILLETELESGGQAIKWLALGVGVNIASALSEIGVALNDLAGKTVDRDAFRDEFLARLEQVYDLWREAGLGPVRARWLALAHRPGTVLKIKLGAEVLDGYFEGLDAAGNLLLRLEDGTVKTIASGEVHFGETGGQADNKNAAGD